ncbi:hypothetical protein ACQPZF_32810 [Actinosynnema sp. CS-041913]|uniref:hypothetical protein n=1 Tax=Actinosynnema sp. CS-041913 TaxID=3239917 RepID=UPI003D8ADF06
MIADRAGGRRVLADALTGRVDPAAAELGLRRRKDALVYRRNVADGFQRLVFDFELHPRYAKDSIVVQPYGEVAFPDVVALARKLDPPRHGVVVDFTLRFDVREYAVGSRRELLVDGPEAAADVAGWVGGLLRDRFGALFTALSSPAAFVAWALGDRDGIGLGARGWIAVAAAQVTLGDAKGALATLEAHLDLDNPHNKEHVRAFDLVRAAAG